MSAPPAEALSGVQAGDADIPRPEHPRPDFRRDEWASLNGRWEFRFDPEVRGIEERWWEPGAEFDREITVPFCWESRLSGIGATSGQQIGWYRREVAVPAEWEGKRVWLRFGAVDWEARVWVNGTEVGGHEGGYTPFELDITEVAHPGETAMVVVRAFDPTDPELPTGKQIGWYTTTSGIWQTVWLEARPECYVAGLSLVPRRGDEGWSLEVEVTVEEGSGFGVQGPGAEGLATVAIASPDGNVESISGELPLTDDLDVASATLRVEEPRLWSPDDPHLYDLTVTVTGPDGVADVVHTYFGLRTIERGRWGDAAHESILLNGRPIYLRGALDQSFNPGGIYTAPSDEFLRRDMELARELGLNFLRLHIKAEEPRRLYWADRLGVLIMQDIPNTWAQSERARQAWERTMREVLSRDRNHPSVIAWCLFNETWGLGNGPDWLRDFRSNRDTQEWVARMWELAKQLDGTRLVEDNSPFAYDHVVTDINSWHFYIDDYERARTHIDEVVRNTYPGSPFNYVGGRAQGNEPLINSEYGAVSAGGGDRDVSWGFRYLTTQLRRHERIQGYVYTELSDIEWEHNGFVNYDRSPKEFGYEAFVPDMTVADLQGADFVGFDAPPAIEARVGETVRVPVFVSHFSERTEAPSLRWWISGTDDLGRTFETEARVRPVEWEPYLVTMQEPIEVVLSAERPFVGALALELVDERGERIAANFVNLIVRPAVPPEQEAPPEPQFQEPPEDEAAGDAARDEPAPARSAASRRSRASERASEQDGEAAAARGDGAGDGPRMLSDEQIRAMQEAGVSPRVEVLGPRLIALRFRPEDFAHAAFDSLGDVLGEATTRTPVSESSGAAAFSRQFYACGAGSVEYRVALPEFVREAGPVALELLAELSAAARDERLDWPQRRNPLDYPQTDGRTHASSVRVEFALPNRSSEDVEGDGTIAAVDFPLPDAPADARGVLSHQAAFHHGSYGYLVHEPVELDAAAREALGHRRDAGATEDDAGGGQPGDSEVVLVLTLGVPGDGPAGGLAIYGERSGRYLIEPTILMHTEQDVERPTGWASHEPVARDVLLERVETLLPTGEQGGHTWRYTTTAPGEGWQQPDFDDSGWQTGTSGFGTEGTPGVAVNTRWDTPEIWLRTEVELPDLADAVALVRYYHDEDIEVYMNGRALLSRRGYVTTYQTHVLGGAEREVFSPGRNRIAIHCRQTGGGQGVDLGLEWLSEAP